MQALLQAEKQKLGHVSGVLTKVDGKYGIIEDSGEDVAARIARLSGFIEDVLGCCKVASCMALAMLEPEKRRIIVEGCGQYGAESIVLASTPGAVLWTDDHTLGRLARGEFGIQRVWTQLVLQSLTLNGQIEAGDFYEASAKLLGWGYSFTSPSPPALEQTGILSDWNPGRWPLKQALEVFSNESLNLTDALRLAGSFLVVIYSGKQLPETERIVAVAILDKLAGRPSGIRGIGAMARVLQSLFGVNVIGNNRAQADIRAWMKHAVQVHPEIL